MASAGTPYRLVPAHALLPLDGCLAYQSSSENPGTTSPLAGASLELSRLPLLLGECDDEAAGDIAPHTPLYFSRVGCAERRIRFTTALRSLRDR